MRRLLIASPKGRRRPVCPWKRGMRFGLREAVDTSLQLFASTRSRLLKLLLLVRAWEVRDKRGAKECDCLVHTSSSSGSPPRATAVPDCLLRRRRRPLGSTTTVWVISPEGWGSFRVSIFANDHVRWELGERRCDLTPAHVPIPIRWKLADGKSHVCFA